uniref:Uncharacterized protein n=1 Tax=Heterosigma akashiwo TaxID=2829 RepID=A0A6V1VHY5_HETAK
MKCQTPCSVLMLLCTLFVSSLGWNQYNSPRQRPLKKERKSLHIEGLEHRSLLRLSSSIDDESELKFDGISTNMKDGTYEDTFEMDIDGDAINLFNERITTLKKALPTARICLECTGLEWIFAQIAQDRGIDAFYSRSATALRKYAETAPDVADATLLLTGKVLEKQVKRLAKFPEVNCIAVSNKEEADILSQGLAAEIARAMKKRRSKVSASRDKYLDAKTGDSRAKGYLESANYILRISSEQQDKAGQQLLDDIEAIEKDCENLNFHGVILDSVESIETYRAIKDKLKRFCHKPDQFKIAIPFDESKDAAFYKDFPTDSRQTLWLVQGKD